jgi:hypothetical protein
MLPTWMLWHGQLHRQLTCYGQPSVCAAQTAAAALRVFHLTQTLTQPSLTALVSLPQQPPPGEQQRYKTCSASHISAVHLTSHQCRPANGTISCRSRRCWKPSSCTTSERTFRAPPSPCGQSMGRVAMGHLRATMANRTVAVRPRSCCLPVPPQVTGDRLPGFHRAPTKNALSAHQGHLDQRHLDLDWAHVLVMHISSNLASAALLALLAHVIV